MALRVKHVMKVPVATVSPSESLYIADGLMSLGELRHLPVLSGGALVGILTHRDILRAPGLLAPVLEFAADTRAALRALRVEEVMSTAVVTIGAEASVKEAAEQLLEHRVGCLPVMEDGRLVGIVTTSDLLRAIAGPREGMADPGEGSFTAPAHEAPSQVRSEA
jgi:CBS domain-containing protein